MSCWVVGVSADEISNRFDDALRCKENQKMKGLRWFRFRWVPVNRRYLLRRSSLVERRGVFGTRVSSVLRFKHVYIVWFG